MYLLNLVTFSQTAVKLRCTIWICQKTHLGWQSVRGHIYSSEAYILFLGLSILIKESKDLLFQAKLMESCGSFCYSQTVVMFFGLRRTKPLSE